MANGVPKLVILTGKLAGRSLPLDRTLIVGRQPGVSLQLPDGKVSREHTKFFQQAGEWYVVDLNSRNGTLVNDAPATKRVLRNGDEILIGETRIKFEEAAPPPIEVTRPPEKKKPAPYTEVVDLREKPEAAPAGAISADLIEVKQKALQYSKVEGRKKPNALFDDIGQRPFLYQLLMILVVLALAVGFLYVGLLLAGVVGGG